MKFFKTLIFTFLISINATGQCSYEQIESFLCEAEILENGDLRITETISVCARGSIIKRGIFREIPSTYIFGAFEQEIRKLEFIEVQRNGKDEPHHTERVENGIRLYIGEENTFVNGIQEYRIVYITDRQLRRTPDGNVELYWNVTGNYWMFSILEAEFRLKLPDGLTTMQFAGYTGKTGSSDSDMTFLFSPDSTTLIARSNNVLRSQEGMTVAIGWEQSEFDKQFPNAFSNDFTSRDYQTDTHLWIGIAIVLGLYFILWQLLGIDPKGRTITPQFNIPDNLNPGLLGYIHKQKYDKSLLSATIIGLAVKGHLKIDQNTKKSYTLTRLKSKEPLDEVESNILKGLVRNVNSSFTIQSTASSGKKVQKVQQSLRSTLWKNRKPYFKRNAGAIIAGILASIGAWVFSIATTNLFFPIPALQGVFALAISTLFYFLLSWILKRRNRKRLNFGWGYKIYAFLIAITPVFVLNYLAMDHRLTPLSPLYSIGITALVFLNDLFIHLLIKPTKNGRRIMDEAKGLLMYLSVAEEKMLDFQHPPEKTPETFEKYLPYAAALGAESRWMKRFEKELKEWENDPDFHHHHLYWYTSAYGISISSFSDGLGSGMASAASSAVSSVPSSSGGSGGGGFSGGGGGGGGGGGW